MSQAPICQSRLPFSPWALPLTRKLPGVQPVSHGRWLFRDDAFAAQMAERDRLVEACPDDIIAQTHEAADAVDELVSLVLKILRRDAGYAPVEAPSGAIAAIRRPDGVEVPFNTRAPMTLLARLVQEDLLILQPGPRGQHVLSAAVLCFPASWTLSQKMGRPLGAIHGPVADYDRNMADRVQRIIDNMFPDAPLWRANWLRYNDPALHRPRPESAPRAFDPEQPWWLRVEYQTFHKLPRTGALVFGIHTFQVPRSALEDSQLASLGEALANRGERL